MGDQFLVRIDVTSVMHRRGLRAAERLGIADQHQPRQRRGLTLAQSSKIGTQKARLSSENRALKCSVGSCAELKATASRIG